MRTIYTFILAIAILLLVDVLPRVQPKVHTIPLKKQSITRRAWHKFDKRDIKNLKANSEPQDSAYFGSVGFGPAGKEQFFPVHFDTGSADLWITSVDCNSKGCGNKPKKYDPRNDSDYVDLKSKFNIEYVIGKVSGEESTTTLNLGGFEVPKQEFGSVDVVSDEFEEVAYVGMIGMAPGPGQNGQVTPIGNLIRNEALDHPQFAFLFGREADHGVSELTIGGTNPDRIDGDITWSDVKGNNGGKWLIEIDGLSVNGERIDFNGDREMFIDTGYNKIYMPINDARAVYAKIPVAKERDDGRFVMPCDNHNFVISLSIKRVTWNMDARDFIIRERVGDGCVGAIEAPFEIGKPNQWIVGTAFLKNVYIIFDLGDDEVGFAKIKVVPKAAGTGSKQDNPLRADPILGQNKTGN